MSINFKSRYQLLSVYAFGIKRNKIELFETPAVIGVPLSSSVAPLEIGKVYRWYFKVYCNQQDSGSPSIHIEGDIQRVSLNSSQEIQLAAAKNPQEKIAIYRNHI